MNDEAQTQKPTELTHEQKRLRIFLVTSAAILFVVVLSGFIYLSTTVTATATYLLSLAGGISNIALPCTLPLVFIIVPMAMVASTRSAGRGIAMTFLFGLGLIITLGIYGATIGFAGQYLGLDNATRIMYSIAGAAALLFGLSELGLLRFEMPSYGGIPRAIAVLQNDYAKVFFLGLLLGNAGVGCPNPVTYVVLTFAATSGDWLQGALLMMVNGVGRVLPLLLLVILGILGVNAVTWLTTKTEAIKKFTAWALIALGSFIFLNGVFGHLWYEGGVFHEGLNATFMSLGGTMIGEADIAIEEFEKPVPFVEYGDWINLVITLLPVLWYWRKYSQNKKEILIVLAVILVWNLLLFDFGFSAMDWIG
ncbi:MAG: sulfite exporter TauE/SafE family protein [Candidatus Yonathbacteria bacterium]|nr:sulfite exporter TauE/SafE family protein [Candidatus Yonathbacteria bacterium]